MVSGSERISSVSSSAARSSSDDERRCRFTVAGDEDALVGVEDRVMATILVTSRSDPTALAHSVP